MRRKRSHKLLQNCESESLLTSITATNDTPDGKSYHIYKSRAKISEYDELSAKQRSHLLAIPATSRQVTGEVHRVRIPF
jgi:hypothetical protein